MKFGGNKVFKEILGVCWVFLTTALYEQKLHLHTIFVSFVPDMSRIRKKNPRLYESCSDNFSCVKRWRSVNLWSRKVLIETVAGFHP